MRLHSRLLRFTDLREDFPDDPLAGGRLALINEALAARLDGLETLRRLHQTQPELQVMILSGRATVQTAVEATKLGATDIFEKPMDVDTLVQRIRAARATRLAHEAEATQEQIEEIMRTKGW